MQATEVYVRADPTEKLDAIEAVIPPSLRRGQFTVPDRLIAMLHGQSLCKVIGAESAAETAPITVLLP
jgi:integrase/recombinase XerD